FDRGAQGLAAWDDSHLISPTTLLRAASGSRPDASREHHFGRGTAVNELRDHFLVKSNSGVPHCSAMRHWPPSRAKRIFTRLMRKGPSIGYGGLRSVPSSKR